MSLLEKALALKSKQLNYPCDSRKKKEKEANNCILVVA